MLCSTLTKSYLLNYARPLIFTTALGLPTLVSIRTAYELLAHGDETTVVSPQTPYIEPNQEKYSQTNNHSSKSDSKNSYRLSKRASTA